MDLQNQYPDVYQILESIYSQITDSITPEQRFGFNSLVECGDPDLAISSALTWCVNGKWKIDESIADSLRNWALESSDSLDTERVEAALRASGLPGKQ